MQPSRQKYIRKRKLIHRREEESSTPINFISGGIKFGDVASEPLESVDDPSTSHTEPTPKQVETTTFPGCSSSLANDPSKFGDWMKFGKADVVTRMMGKMGYQEGSGLGKAKQGIVEPVDLAFRTSRGGVGHEKGMKVPDFGKSAADAPSTSTDIKQRHAEKRKRKRERAKAKKTALKDSIQDDSDSSESAVTYETKLESFDTDTYFPLREGRDPSTVADPISTFTQFLALGKDLRTSLVGEKGFMQMMKNKYDIIKVPLNCSACGMFATHPSQLFIHCLGKPHFNMITSQKKVFSLSKDFERLRKIVNEARSEYMESEANKKKMKPSSSY